MTLERRPVERDHLKALFRLKVRKDQDGLVAPNEFTLAQAAYEPGSHVWGLWVGSTPVGLMAVIHPGQSAYIDDGDDPEALYVWRLMIGADHQGKGHGKAALDMAVDLARDWGLPRVSLTVADETYAAFGFYESCGFAETGRVVDDEREMKRDV